MNDRLTMERLIEVLGSPAADATKLVPVAGSKRYVPARALEWACGCNALQAARLFRATFGEDVQFEPCSDEHDCSMGSD